MNSEDSHILQRWFSVGDIVSLVAMLLALGITYGSLSRDVESLKSDVAELRAMRITPGAETALASMRARDESQDQQLIALRQEMREQRREILDGIRAIEAQLDAHMSQRP
jgi:hypothetical protein